MFIKILSLLVLISLAPKVYSADMNSDVAWDGLKSSLTYFVEGSYMQFTAKNNLYYAAAAAPSLWYSFKEDDRISANERKKHIPKYMKISSDLAPVLSFPIIPMSFFYYGVKTDNSKSVQFAKETFAAMYLALLESAAISVIDVHERPDKRGLSKWETNFRGDSSFPSGHVVPYAVLALKTLQFYGPYYAIAPTALLLATSVQRVRDGKHYLSDVVGGIFLSAFAAEGVRKAANYQDTNVVYKVLFERNLRVGHTTHGKAIGPMFTIDW